MPLTEADPWIILNLNGHREVWQLPGAGAYCAPSLRAPGTSIAPLHPVNAICYIKHFQVPFGRPCAAGTHLVYLGLLRQVRSQQQRYLSLKFTMMIGSMAVGLSSLRGPAPVVGCPHRRLIAMPLRLGSRLVTRAIATPVSPSSRLLPGLLPRTPTPVPAPVSPPPASATPPAAAPASPAQQLWSGYLRSLKWQPMAIKAATSFCCTLLGDSIAQMVGGVPFSAARVLKLSAYSALVGSSTGHAWHAWLDATVMPHAPSSAAAVGMKVLLDQLIFTPGAPGFYCMGTASTVMCSAQAP